MSIEERYGPLPQERTDNSQGTCLNRHVTSASLVQAPTTYRGWNGLEEHEKFPEKVLQKG